MFLEKEGADEAEDVDELIEEEDELTEDEEPIEPPDSLDEEEEMDRFESEDAVTATEGRVSCCVEAISVTGTNSLRVERLRTSIRSSTEFYSTGRSTFQRWSSRRAKRLQANGVSSHP